MSRKSVSLLLVLLVAFLGIVPAASASDEGLRRAVNTHGKKLHNTQKRAIRAFERLDRAPRSVKRLRVSIRSLQAIADRSGKYRAAVRKQAPESTVARRGRTDALAGLRNLRRSMLVLRRGYARLDRSPSQLPRTEAGVRRVKRSFQRDLERAGRVLRHRVLRHRVLRARARRSA